jgi:two-component system LytT family response regulator
MTMRVLIVDDEPAARAKMRRLLRAVPDVEIVGEAGDGASALRDATALLPDVMLLDIQMPELDGFAAVEGLSRQPRPLVIFVTGYDVHALRAFEVHAFDYLLKPFDSDRLRASLERAREQLALQRRPDANALQSVLAELRSGAAPAPRYLDRVAIRSPGRVICVRLAEVEWIEGSGNYVRLHTATGRPLLRATLTKLSSQLDPAHFARIHRSAIVNLDCIREMQPYFSGDYVVILRSGTRLRLSRSYRQAVEDRLGRV